jgi:hypothetical protein
MILSAQGGLPAPDGPCGVRHATLDGDWGKVSRSSGQKAEKGRFFWSIGREERQEPNVALGGWREAPCSPLALPTEHTFPLR